jgi:hypothetical protein
MTASVCFLWIYNLLESQVYTRVSIIESYKNLRMAVYEIKAFDNIDDASQWLESILKFSVTFNS